MSDLLASVVWGNLVSRWLVAIGTTVGAYAAFVLAVRVSVRRLARLAARTSTDVDDFVASMLAKTRNLVLLLVAAFAGSLLLTLPSGVVTGFRTAALLAGALQVGIWLSAAVDFTVGRYREKAITEDPGSVTMVGAMGFLGKLVVWVVILLLALDNLGVDITALVASVGIGGIAVALAVQNILGDLFASLSIVLDKPFVIGDFLVVGDQKGRVESIGLKTTRLRSLTGEQLVLANGDLLESRIRNYGRMYERRASLNLGVTYDTPREKLEALPDMVREAIESEDGIRFDRAHFTEFGAYSLNVEAVYYVLNPDYSVYLDIQQRINLDIHRRFEEAGIEFAFPTQVVYLSSTPEEDGARAAG